MTQTSDIVSFEVRDDAVVVVILHDLEDEDLVVLEGFPVKVDQVSEEINQFGFVVGTFLRLDGVADQPDECGDIHIVVQHTFVVVVHLLQQIYHSDVVADMADHLGQDA